ncbi:MAG TPA: RDD family protein [Methylocystis sp.]|nr:RDD family protein [Methylocystis sp.]
MSHDGAGDGLRPEPFRPPLHGGIPRAALEGVRSRRVVALCLDFVLVSIISGLLFASLALLSFGATLILLPPIFPLTAFFYNGLTVSGPRMATPGMAFMDLEMRGMDGGRVPFINAAAHAVLFYVTTLLPPLLLISFITNDKRCLHDILADVIVLRRSAPPGDYA